MGLIYIFTSLFTAICIDCPSAGCAAAAKLSWKNIGIFRIPSIHIIKPNIKVKQSHYRSGVAQKVPGS